MRHKHADLIIAWANGAEIQDYDVIDEVWGDNARPAWIETCKYRIKPKTKTIKYKRYVYSCDGKRMLGIMNGSECALLAPGSEWIDTEWQEIEVEDV
jgi:hypothetical protein